MYVTVYKSKNGVDYVRISETYKDENGKQRHRSVKSLGRLDKQLEQNPNFLEELKAKYRDSRDARIQAARALHLQEAADILATPSEDDEDRAFPLLRFGNLILRRLWKDVLGMDTHLSYLQKTKTFLHYDLNRAAAYLTFMKVLDPHSVLHSHNDRIDFLGAPARDISLDDCYDCYSRLKEYKDNIIRHLNKKLDAIYGKNRATLIFYDVTNAYFESQMTDEEKGLRTDDYIERLAEYADACRSRKINSLGNECFTPEGCLIVEKLPEWFIQEVADEKIEFFRMRGPSKEHRFDLPLVSIALVIDQKGIPMDFEVYAGNASEFKTMPKSIERLKRTYGIKDAIVVADRGLNSLDNLSMLLGNNLGFLVAQKVTNLGAETTKIMLNLEEYQPINKEIPEIGCYRTISNWKKTGKGGKTVECTLVLTWNEARKKRDEALLNLAVKTVKKKMEAGVKIGPRKNGWSLFAKTEGGKEQKIIGVDEEAVAKRRKFCGFAAIIYSNPDTNDETITLPLGAEIADTYHRLNRIESCFRAMKSNLGLRPIYVRKSDRIQGHIMVCFLALVLVRILQEKLDAKGRHMSIEGLCSSLNDALLMAWKSDRDVFFAQVRLHGSDCGRGMTVREYREKQKKGIPIRPTTLSDILRACNLHPLPRIARMPEVARCLGTLWTKVEDAIPKERMAEI